MSTKHEGLRVSAKHVGSLMYVFICEECNRACAKLDANRGLRYNYQRVLHKKSCSWTHQDPENFVLSSMVDALIATGPAPDAREILLRIKQLYMQD